jgi:hypothetical protein
MIYFKHIVNIVQIVRNNMVGKGDAGRSQSVDWYGCAYQPLTSGSILNTRVTDGRSMCLPSADQ